MNDRIYSYLLQNDVIIDRELFDYGLFTIKTYSSYLIVILPVSFIFGSLFETLIFVFLFISLRRFIGGYHLENMNMCFLFSVILAIVIPLIARAFQATSIILLMVLFVLCFILTREFGVMDHPNKVITDSEKITYLNKALTIESVYFIVAVLSNYIGLAYISNIILLIYLFFIISTVLCKNQ